MNTSWRYVAATDIYSCGTYDSGAYNDNDCTTTSTSGNGDGNLLGPLTGVGPVVVNPYFIVGAVLIIAAIVAAIILRRRT